MSKRNIVLVLLLVVLFSAGSVWGQNTPITKANYDLAAKWGSTRGLVPGTSVRPGWLEDGVRFWYSYGTLEGTNFYLVDPARETKRPLFDNADMAAQLSTITGQPYDAKHLPISTITFAKDDTVFQFNVTTDEDEIIPQEERSDRGGRGQIGQRGQRGQRQIQERDQQQQERGRGRRGEQESQSPRTRKKQFKLEYDLATKKLYVQEEVEEEAEAEEEEAEEPEKPRWATVSPDGETIVFARNHNLYWMDKENYEEILEDPNADVEEHQLTEDGEEKYSFGGGRGGQRGGRTEEAQEEENPRSAVSVQWSRDGRNFSIIRRDSRLIKDLWVINSLSNPRPTLETYSYQMPGEPGGDRELFIFNRDTEELLKIDTKYKEPVTLSVMTKPREGGNQRGGGRAPQASSEDNYSYWLSEDSNKCIFQRKSRDYKKFDVCYADATTGEVTVMIAEKSTVYIDISDIRFINDEKEWIYHSERDGWAHYYLYDNEGNLKNQITKGPFYCSSIVGLDEENRIMYFQANGRELNEDPYYKHLYRINLDGSGLKLLNRGNYDHSVTMNEDSTYFVDNFSRVNTAPRSVVRDTQGNIVVDLETADLSRLEAKGYIFPEPYVVKSADGVTDIYGVMYKPYDFDPTKKYPIIAYVYPGPQTESVSKTFSAGGTTERMAQFGFIMITVGNRGGHPNRSKWYHTYGMGNFRNYGLPDKKAAIEQLADRYPFIDIDKVGIFGHSGGGFMSTAALLVYPDFFKVAVSSSGNHENNVYNRSWSEKHNGIKEVINAEGEVEFVYEVTKNSEVASNLKGRLFLVHGEIDNNVHPANTYRMVDALMKANKRFDMFIFPGNRHGIGGEYWFYLRADYFCEHLIGDSHKNVDMYEIDVNTERTNANTIRR